MFNYTVVFAVRKVSEFLTETISALNPTEAMAKATAEFGLGLVDVRGPRPPVTALGLYKKAIKAFNRVSHAGQAYSASGPKALNPHYSGFLYEGNLVTKEVLLATMTGAERARYQEAKAEAMRMRSARKARRSGKGK